LFVRLEIALKLVLFSQGADETQKMMQSLYVDMSKAENNS